MDYSKLSQEELIAALQERDTIISELQTAHQQELKALNDSHEEDLKTLKQEHAEEVLAQKEEIKALTETITELQEENAAAPKVAGDTPVVKVGKKKYAIQVKSLRDRDFGVVTAEELAKNEGGKFDKLLEKLLEKGGSMIKEV